jgi:hypothetical protein
LIVDFWYQKLVVGTDQVPHFDTNKSFFPVGAGQDR